MGDAHQLDSERSARLTSATEISAQRAPHSASGPGADGQGPCSVVAAGRTTITGRDRIWERSTTR
ncbi:hypothetical protein ACFWA5_35260 [Streptomyces mirabilis]|uniref:hypothetical protein n=1 Tax=Streptomyces mirabilis TaxID=68239 RepID=UPI003663BE98